MPMVEAGFEGDFLAGAAMGMAAAVPVFMMGQGDTRGALDDGPAAILEDAVADSAAIRITKLTTPAAPGICVAAITMTKGLCPTPAAVHGTRATMRDRVKR